MNNKITKEQLAEQLNGREYGDEVNNDEQVIAKENNLVIIFGYSDDNLEFRGVIDDEIGAWNGVTCYIDKKTKRIWNTVDRYIDENELSEDFEDIVQNYFDNNCIKIEAKLNDYWEIKAEGIEYSKFDILEDGEKYSDGIIINL